MPADTVNFEATDGSAGGVTASPWTVSGGSGNDTVNLSPVAMTLANLDDGVTFNGGGGSQDTFNLRDNNTGSGDTYTVTSTTVDRSLWGDQSNPGATYNAAVEFINLVTTGGGDDIVNINSTSATATTTINAGPGNDTINVSSNAPTNTGNLDAIAGTLTIDAGTGTNTLAISDFSSATANASVVVTNNQITPLRRTGRWNDNQLLDHGRQLQYNYVGWVEHVGRCLQRAEHAQRHNHARQ